MTDLFLESAFQSIAERAFKNGAVLCKEFLTEFI